MKVLPVVLLALLLIGGLLALLWNWESPSPGPAAPEPVDTTEDVTLVGEILDSPEARNPVVRSAGEIDLIVRKTDGVQFTPTNIQVEFTLSTDDSVTVVDAEFGQLQEVRLEQGKYYVRAGEDAADLGGAKLWPDRVRIPEDPINEPLELLLSADHAFELITEDADGVPVADVRVMFRRQGAAPIKRLVTTNEVGRASQNLPCGEYGWEVESERFQPISEAAEHRLNGIVSVAEDSPDTLLVRLQPPVLHELSVAVNLFGVNGQLDPERITDLRLWWRGQFFQPRLGDDGVFRARKETMMSSEGDGTPARLFLCGSGIREVNKSVSDPGADQMELRIAQGVHLLEERVEAVLLDHADQPVADRTLNLKILQAPDSTTYRGEIVTTDESGRFEIVDIATPFKFHVSNQIPGKRYEPNETSTRTVEDTERVVQLRELPAHRVVLHVRDRAFATAASGRTRGAVVIDVLPLTRIGTELRTPWSNGLKGLSLPESQRLASTGCIELGDLPAGEYLATLFVSDLGTANASFSVDPQEGLIEVDLPYVAASDACVGRLESGGARLVIDGYVPRSALARIENSAAMLADSRSLPAGGWAVPEADGAFAIRQHNALLSEWTVLLDDGGVRRVAKGSSEFGAGDVRRGVGDGEVRGRALDAHGDPLAGVVVNLTAVRGGERHGVIPPYS